MHNLKSASYGLGEKTMTLKRVTEELQKLKDGYGGIGDGLRVYRAISNFNMIKCILDVNKRFKDLEKTFPELKDPDVQNIHSESNKRSFWSMFADRAMKVFEAAKKALENSTGISEFVKNMKKMPLLFKTRAGLLTSFDLLKSLTPLLTTHIDEETFNNLSEEVENTRNDKKKPTMSYEYFREKFMDEPSREYEAGNKLNVIVDRFADFVIS